MAEACRDDLMEWLAPFVGLLCDRRRERLCPPYVEGLIGPGDRKSVQPMAMRLPGIGYDQLHHFIGGALWDSGTTRHGRRSSVGTRMRWLVAATRG